MKKYQEEVGNLEAQRQELTNAEKLFELPITMYPELQKVQKETKGLEQIYDIYSEQKVCESLSKETFTIGKVTEFMVFSTLTTLELTIISYRIIQDFFVSDWTR